MHNTLYWAGVLVGLAVSIPIVMLLLRWMRGGHGSGFFSKCSEYDERQNAARGKAYRDGFWAMAVASVLCAALTELLPLPVAASSIILISCFLGLGVFVVSCIMRDAYIGLHDNVSRWLVIIVAAGGLNLWLGLGLWPFTLEDRGPRWLNLFCALLMAVVLAAMGVKAVLDSRAQDEEER